MPKDNFIKKIPYKIAIPNINRSVMEDNAWIEIFEKRFYAKYKDGKYYKHLSHNERLTITVIIAWTYIHDGQTTTTDLVRALQEFLDKGKDSVINVLRNLEHAGFLKQRKNEDKATIYHWYIANEDIIDNYKDLMKVIHDIDEVIKIQIKNPRNINAGKDLIPENIYYNTSLNRYRRLPYEERIIEFDIDENENMRIVKGKKNE